MPHRIISFRTQLAPGTLYSQIHYYCTRRLIFYYSVRGNVTLARGPIFYIQIEHVFFFFYLNHQKICIISFRFHSADITVSDKLCVISWLNLNLSARRLAYNDMSGDIVVIELNVEHRVPNRPELKNNIVSI